MPTWLQVLLFILAIVGVFVGFVWGIPALIEYIDRERVEMLRWCMENGYADVIRYEPARMDFCIGVIDGEWSIKPVEVN